MCLTFAIFVNVKTENITNKKKENQPRKKEN